MLMGKSMKRMVAIVSALTLFVSGMGCITAQAASESVEWYARHVAVSGVPSDAASEIGYASLHASSEEYVGKVTSMSDIVNRKLILSSTTHKMSKGDIEYNNMGSVSWKISGSISQVTYKMEAYTVSGILHVRGVIER